MAKKTFQFLLFCGLLFILNLGLGLFLERPVEALIKKGEYDPYSRWRDFYAQPDNSVDVIFIGSSHAYYSFDPAIFDAGLGARSFNLGSGAQRPSTSYFALKQALENQKPKLVIWEAFWPTFLKGDEFFNASYNYGFIRSPQVRREFYWQGLDWQGRLALLFPSFRYSKNLYDAIRMSLGKDITQKSWGRYKDKGYEQVDDAIDEQYLRDNKQFEGFVFRPRDAAPKQVEYIRKMVELCRSRGIRVMFITAPMPAITIAKIKNYGRIHAFVRDLASGLGVTYLDFNTDGPKDLFMVKDFADAGHLNTSGVRKLDTWLVSRLKRLLSN